MSRPSTINKILAMDCETTGLKFGSLDPSIGHQSLSWGMIVADANFKELDSLYLEIKWDGVSNWETRAEQVHGLSRDYLEANGMDKEDAAATIAEFILKHFDIDESIVCLGHNVRNFDLPFLVRLLSEFDLKFKFAHRAIDTFSPGFVLAGKTNSDEIFQYFGMPPRHQHNALEDARRALKVCRNIRRLWKQAYAE